MAKVTELSLTPSLLKTVALYHGGNGKATASASAISTIATADNYYAERFKGEEPMINPISTNGTPSITPQAVKADRTPVKSEQISLKLETSLKDSVTLSPSAQARILRRAGQSIPQIAIKLGLAIPTVAAYFE
jgi:hypothetical protein